MCQIAYICVSVCASTCHDSLISPSTLSLSLHLLLLLLLLRLRWLEAESNLSLRLTPAVDAALWLASLTVSTGFFG